MDILGIGNALLDIFCFSDDELSLSLALHPNHAAHVSPERLDELLLAVRDPIFVSGGSASNSVKAASLLGADCAFIGCVGTEDRESDRWAALFRSELSAFGVRCRLESRNAPTGRCLVIHMPGSLKAVACAPGAAPSLQISQIEGDVIAQARVVLADGQVLRNADVFERIAALCLEHKVPLAVDIGSSDIARAFGPAIQKILTENDVILFVNGDASSLLALSLANTVPSDLGPETEEQFINSIFSFYTSRNHGFPIIVETRGKNGAKAWLAGKTWIADPTAPTDHPLDDTGAGDVFAGAFLTAFLRGLTPDRTLDFANAAAGKALHTPGTRLDRDDFAELKTGLDA